MPIADLPAAKTIELVPPVEFGNKQFDKLELREPLAGEVDKATRETTDLRRTIILLSHVSGWPGGAIERLPVSIMLEAGKYCWAFTAMDDAAAAIEAMKD
jgi:hypothetical protein